MGNSKQSFKILSLSEILALKISSVSNEAISVLAREGCKISFLKDKGSEQFGQVSV